MALVLKTLSQKPLSIIIFPIIGDSDRKENVAEVDCSACHPSRGSRLSINSTALATDHTHEWKSLPRAPDSHFQELNITINFPQVCHETEKVRILRKPILVISELGSFVRRSITLI